MSIFGFHDIPLNIKEEGLSISIQKEKGGLFYNRDCLDEKMEKLILSDTNKVIINPIEPLHKPKEVTTKLLIEFNKSIVLPPHSAKKIFLTSPVEIGIFVYDKKVYEILDIFTLARQKLSMYGDIKRGVIQTEGHICKYWKSDVHTSIPSTDPLTEGVIELTINNTSPRWQNVTKIVLNAYHMKLYYNNNLVSMKATMKILSKTYAETGFRKVPLEEGMTKSLELYTATKVPMLGNSFIMEAGI